MVDHFFCATTSPQIGVKDHGSSDQGSYCQADQGRSAQGGNDQVAYSPISPISRQLVGISNQSDS